MNALILVDIQNDFLPGGALAVPRGEEIIRMVNNLVTRFSLVVATQDWHPANHGSFASAHPGKDVFELHQLGELDQVLWPDHCVQGTNGAEFASELNLNTVEAIFRKGTDVGIDSYSGFFDNGRKKATGMGDYLKGRGVKKVFVCGLAADFCVGFTALDALSLGFETIVLEDATRAIDPAGWSQMKQNIQQQSGRVITTAQL
ncbi:MAG: bifunctional nicotinamidase/pyrazinamidase [Bacteroidales bacterium]